MGLVLTECGYSVRTISDETGLRDAYRLRHTVFSEKLAWTARSGSGLETDAYDGDAVHFGLYSDEGTLAAYVRLVSSSGGFMIDDVFRKLVGEWHVIRRDPDTVEASRFCISPDFRNSLFPVGSVEENLAVVLVKGIYKWSICQGVRYMYAVAEEGASRYFRSLGIPLVSIGLPVRMADGAISRAYLLDWREFERFNHEHDPEFMKWFTSWPERQD